MHLLIQNQCKDGDAFKRYEKIWSLPPPTFASSDCNFPGCAWKASDQAQAFFHHHYFEHLNSAGIAFASRSLLLWARLVEPEALVANVAGTNVGHDAIARLHLPEPLVEKLSRDPDQRNTQHCQRFLDAWGFVWHELELQAYQDMAKVMGGRLQKVPGDGNCILASLLCGIGRQDYKNIRVLKKFFNEIKEQCGVLLAERADGRKPKLSFSD
jgi:hypothetical protein